MIREKPAAPHQPLGVSPRFTNRMANAFRLICGLRCGEM